MLVLDATTKSITAQMSSAATTTNPSFVTAYSDDNGTTFVEGSSDGALNGSTQVSVVAAPAASTRRLIKTIYIANIDTVANTITVTLNDNSTLRTIVKVTLNSGDTWSTDGTTDQYGNLKTTVGSVNLANVTGTLAVLNGGTGANTLTGYVYGNGTSAMTASTTIPTTSLSGTVTNAQLANSSLTVNGTSIELGASGTVTAAAGTLTGTTLNSTVVTSSLTSVGTIGTGTWNGSVIGSTYGGTGVNNGSSIITIGGNLTFSGASPFTATLTGSTSVTFPTSGTLVNTAVTTLSSLTSVGTIATGVWNGTIITGTYGGTGVNNGSNTITLGGSFTTSGAFTTTLTVTANTNVTLPTTGTLATLAGSETFTNKTLTNPTITAYLETAPSIANSSTAVTLSLSSGTVLSYTLTGNCTFTMPTATSGTSFIVKLIQDGTGSRTATFTGVKWPGGTAPTITTTATTGLDILSFVCINSVWYGTYAQAFA